jgi:hypothetical protein
VSTTGPEIGSARQVVPTVNTIGVVETYVSVNNHPRNRIS